MAHWIWVGCLTLPTVFCDFCLTHINVMSVNIINQCDFWLEDKTATRLGSMGKKILSDLVRIGCEGCGGGDLVNMLKKGNLWQKPFSR